MDRANQSVSGVAINLQMTFERLMTHLRESQAKQLIGKWNQVLSPESREIVGQLIDLAYVVGKEDAASELQRLLPIWMEQSLLAAVPLSPEKQAVLNRACEKLDELEATK